MSSNQMLTRAVTLTLVAPLAIWAVELWLFLSHVSDHPDTVRLSESAERTLFVLIGIALALAVLRYVAWEIDNGTAFSYFFPLHGHRRIDDCAWRLGIFVRTDFLAVLLQVLLVLFFRHDHDAFLLSGVPLLSPITTWEILLYTVCQLLVELVLLLYTLAGQYYSVRCADKPLLPPANENKQLQE